MNKTDSVFKEPYQILEQEYKEFVGSHYAVSCSSGTAALHLALMALKIGPGDQVIIPDFTMAAILFAVLYTGADPIFCDVDEKRYAIRPDEIEKKITSKTKAIIVVHTYGRLAPMDKIRKVAKGIPIIEDACEAQGAVYKSKADMTVYSFYKNKIIHAEEGGMITTNKKFLADRMAFLKNMAFTPAHDYYHPEVGYNYRMTNSQAKMALRSLKNYQKSRTKRRWIESWYDTFLPKDKILEKRDAIWFYEYFGDQGIVKKISSARLPFKQLSSFPMCVQADTPVSKMLSERLVLLPANIEMMKEDIKNICQKI